MSSTGLNNPTSRMSRSNVGRARIQEIIADARATLKDPSRPITPMALDQRTSLSSSAYQMMDNRDSIASNYNNILRQKKASASFSSSSSSTTTTSTTTAKKEVSRSTSSITSKQYQQQQQHTSSSSNNYYEFDSEVIEDGINTSSLHYDQDYRNSTGVNTRYTQRDHNRHDDEDDDNDEYAYQQQQQSSSSRRSNSSSSSSSYSTKTVTEQQQYRQNNREPDIENDAMVRNALLERKSSAASEGKLALNDFRDQLTNLDLELNTNPDIDDQEFLTVLLELKANSDLLMKKYKNSKGTSASLGHQDLLEVQTVLWDVTTRISELSIKSSLKQCYYALILKYSIHTFSADEISLHQSSTTLRMIEYLSQAIYNLRITVNSGINVSSSGKVTSSSMLIQSQESLSGGVGGNSNSSSRPSTANRGGRERDNNSTTTTTALQGEDETNSIISILDTIMEGCLFAWNQAAVLLDIIYKQQQGSMESTSERESNSGATTSTSTTSISIRLFSNASINYLFNIAALNTAMLRAYSNDETDRKRLLHANVVELTVKGLRLYEKNSCLVQLVNKFNELKQQQQSLSLPKETTTRHNTKMDKKSIKSLKKKLSVILEKALPSLIQLIGMIRNLSLDKTGRNALSQQNITSKMCLLLSTYRNQPEVILNIARVLAKLSLYDSFRSQISSNKKYIELLINVIHHEANTCRSIMENANQEDEDDDDGDDGDDEDTEEEASWPAWHTWPVISRIAFTLGNLTTTNETNRSIIGVNMDGASSILLLLQVCASSLSRINSQKNQSKSETIFTFGNVLSSASNPYVCLDEEDPNGQLNKSFEEQQYEIDQNAEIELRDAIIKLVRLLANLSIDGQVGIEVGSKNDNLQTLLELLMICDQSMEHEEMLLNVIAALTNLTFYTCQFLQQQQQKQASSTDSRQIQRLERSLVTLSTHLSNSLFHENTEIVLETSRVLGNLTRRTIVIQSLIKNRMDEALLLLFLQHVQPDIVSSVAGVIVNFSSHSDGRKRLLQDTSVLAKSSVYTNGIVMKIAGLLRRLTMQDILIALLLSQILHNLIGSNEFSDYQQRENVSMEKIVLTLQEWMEIAQDLIEEYKTSSVEDGGFSEEDLQLYKQFSKVANSIVGLATPSSANKK